MKKEVRWLKIVLIVVAMSMIAIPATAKKRSSPSLKDTVKEAIREEMGSGNYLGAWEYMATRMHPPRNDKWKAKWNNMGTQGWELVGRDENIYIFKRPATYSALSTPAATEEAAPKKVETSKEAPVVEPVVAPEEPVSTPKVRKSGRKSW